MQIRIDAQPDTPLTESTFFILLSISSEPKHGYAIVKDVHTLSEGRIILTTGTLYGAIKRLLEQGWIERIDTPDEAESGRLKKTYVLTDIGQRILSAEVARLETLVRAARLRPVEEIR